MTRTSAGLVPVLITALAALASAENADRPRITVEPVNPWTHLDLRNDPDHFQFAIVTDRTGGHREGVFADAMGKLNLLQPEFVMSVGDLIEGYTEDRETLDAEWDEFDGFLDVLDMPFFYLPGNHDISNEVMADVWSERFGRAYYSFVYRDVLFVGLNSEDGEPGNVGPGQRDWLAGVLGEHRDVRWTLVFVHKPLWNYVDGGELRDTGWAEVEELLRGRRHTVFAGHFHRYTKHVRNDSRYFVLATTGGGSSLAGPLYGQFDHVVWVTMTDDGPRIANLMLDGIWDEDIRTEEMARLVGPLISGGAVVVEPILGRSKRFGGGVTSIRLTNDADVPLRISARFAEHALLLPSPASIDRELPPNSVERIDLEISTERERSVDELSPLQLQWQAEYVQDELEIPAVDGSAPMVVSRIYELPRRTAAPVVVDGDLSDWDQLAFHVPEPAEIDVDADSWTGPDDCSWRFGVEYDDENLYVAVEVTDERRIYLGANAWSQDGLELRVDGRSDPERSRGRDASRSVEERVFVAISPGERLEEMVLVAPEELDSLGVQAVGIPTPAGHAYEVSIPLAYIEHRQGRDWRRLRLNIAVDDFDEETGPLAQLWWQPDWRDATNFPGSGTFEREP